MCQSFFEAPLVGNQGAQVAVRPGQIGPQTYCLLHAGHGLVQSAQSTVGETEVVMRNRYIGLEPNGLLGTGEQPRRACPGRAGLGRCSCRPPPGEDLAEGLFDSRPRPGPDCLGPW